MPGFAAGETLAGLRAVLPPGPLRAAWRGAGRPVVLILPDHLGPDARAGYQAEALAGRAIAVALLEEAPNPGPAAPGAAGWDRLLPRAVERPGRAEARLPALFAALRRLAAEAEAAGDGPRPVGVLGFGEGGEAALLAAQEEVAARFLPAAGPRFAAHAALYPGCAGPALPRLRRAGAPLTGAPVLMIFPHAGGAGDLPGGCATLFDPPRDGRPDPFQVRAYDSLGYGFDLWAAAAWAAGAAPEALRFDMLRAGMARQEVSAFFAAALGGAGSGLATRPRVPPRRRRRPLSPRRARATAPAAPAPPPCPRRARNS